jgi:DNA-directed RNA polymerase subunit N (RpoN/RPB10)
MIHELILAGESENVAKEHALNKLNLTRICCRIAVLTYVNLHDKHIDQDQIETNILQTRPITTKSSFIDLQDWNSDEEHDES